MYDPFHNELYIILILHNISVVRYKEDDWTIATVQIQR